MANRARMSRKSKHNAWRANNQRPNNALETCDWRGGGGVAVLDDRRCRGTRWTWRRRQPRRWRTKRWRGQFSPAIPAARRWRVPACCSAAVSLQTVCLAALRVASIDRCKTFAVPPQQWPCGLQAIPSFVRGGTIARSWLGVSVAIQLPPKAHVEGSGATAPGGIAAERGDPARSPSFAAREPAERSRCGQLPGNSGRRPACFVPAIRQGSASGATTRVRGARTRPPPRAASGLGGTLAKSQ